MKAQIQYQREGGLLEVERTLRGRLWAALIVMVKVFPFAAGGLAIFFAPDVLFGDVVEKEPFPGLFWLSLLGISIIIMALAGLVRFLRRERWVFDGSQGFVRAEVYSFIGAPAVGEAGLDEIKKLHLELGRGLGQSALWMELSDGAKELLFSGNGVAAELEALAQRIEEYLKEQRYFISIERSGKHP